MDYYNKKRGNLQASQHKEKPELRDAASQVD